MTDFYGHLINYLYILRFLLVKFFKNNSKIKLIGALKENEG